MTVEQKFVGDASDLLKEYDKILKKIAKQEQELSKLAAKNRRFQQQQSKGSQDQGKLLKLQVGTLGAIAGGYQLVRTAAATVTRELEKQQQIQEAAKRFAVTVAESEAKVAKNIGLGVSNDELNKFLGELKGIQKETTFKSIEQLNLAAADLLSATGDQKTSLSILKNAGAFFNDSPEDLPSFAGSVGDVASATENPETKKSIALLMSIFSNARFTELGAFKNVAPAISGGINAQDGVDKTQAARFTGALIGAVGKSLGDSDASLTGTSVIALEVGLRRAIGGKGKSTQQRLEEARDRIEAGDKELLDEILKSGFRAKTKISAEKLFDRNSKISRSLDEILPRISISEEQLDKKKNQLLGGTTALRLANQINQNQGSAERTLRDTNLDIRGAVQQLVFGTSEKPSVLATIDNSNQSTARRIAQGLIRGVESLSVSAASTDEDAVLLGQVFNARGLRNATNDEQRKAIREVNFQLLQLSRQLQERELERSKRGNVAAQNQAQNERD